VQDVKETPSSEHSKVALASFAEKLKVATGELTVPEGPESMLVCGAALTYKIQKRDNVAVAFVGDGGSNQGTTLESLNLAKIWNLAAIFVVENNGYAEATASKWAVATPNVADRAQAYGFEGVVVDVDSGAVVVVVPVVATTAQGLRPAARSWESGRETTQSPFASRMDRPA